MPSLVTLVCAEAGRTLSASAPTARPSAFSDFDMSISSPLARIDAKGKAVFSPSPFSFWLSALSHRPVAVHGVDLAGVAFVHKASLQFHGRRQLFVLGR